MNRVRLNRAEWRYDEAQVLGAPGGFGTVFRGLDDSGGAVAVKRLNLDAERAAHRELRIAEELAGVAYRHVMPVLDSGQDADSDMYFVVMPMAETTLQETIDQSGPRESLAAARILSEIATGLDEVVRIVHRDLKPANVLWYDGRWHVADFGIARFVEATTSTATLAQALTPAYAAPEQWRGESATGATDIYALGCIGYALLTGKPPFSGNRSELQQQHLQSLPNELPSADPRLRSLLSRMLRKSPEVRPSLTSVRNTLRQLDEGREFSSPTVVAGLVAGVAAHERLRSEEEARRQQASLRLAQRNAAASEAYLALEELFGELHRRLSEVLPLESVHRIGHAIQLPGAAIELSVPPTKASALAETRFPRTGWDVIAGSALRVVQFEPRYEHAASLWYSRMPGSGTFRWYEASYRANPMYTAQFEYRFSRLDPEDADLAHGPAMAHLQEIYSPQPIDLEDQGKFLERWLFVLGEAVNGRLKTIPQGLPGM